MPQGGQWQNTDYSADRQRVEEGLFSRLNPQIDRQRQQLETDLVNRGIRPGSTAYSAAQSDFNQGLNDQRTSILLQGGQEQSRLQNMALNQFGAQNTQRQNALSEMLTRRQVPLNEILALSGQSQLQQPNFANTPQTGVAGTDIAGITNANYAQQMQGYQQNQGMIGGLFSAGASLIPLLSDVRSKTDIVKVGQLNNGLGVYIYKYHGEEPYHLGLIAQEVEEIHPDAVVEIEGRKHVIYDKAII